MGILDTLGGGGSAGGGGGGRGGGGGILDSLSTNETFVADQTAKVQKEEESRLAKNKRDFATSLKRLIESGAREDAARILSENRGVFTDEEMKKYGLSEFEKSPSWLKYNKEPGSSGLGKAVSYGDKLTGGALSKTLDTLDKPSQGSLATLSAFRRGDIQGALLASPISPTSYFGGQQAVQSSQDQDEDSRLNFREALGMKHDAGGAWGGVADFLATTATDPITFTTFGSGAAGKTALRAVAREFGEDAARQISNMGRRALREGLEAGGRKISAEEVQALFTRVAAEEVANVAARRTTQRLVKKYGPVRARDIISKRHMQALERSGRSGLRVGSPFGSGQSQRTLIPSRPFGRSIPILQAKYPWEGNRILRAAGRALRVGDEVGDIARLADGGSSAPHSPPPPFQSSRTPFLEGRDPTLDAQGLLLDKDPFLTDRFLLGVGDEVPGVGRVVDVTEDGIATVAPDAAMLTPRETVFRAPQRVTEEGLPFADETFDQRLLSGETTGPRLGPEGALSDLPQPGQILTPSVGETQFQVLGRTSDGDLVVQIVDENALVPFTRPLSTKGNARFRVDGAEGLPDAPNRGKIARRGQVTFDKVPRGSQIPGLGVVRTVDDEGRFILRVPQEAAESAVERSGGLLRSNLPQRTAQDSLEFADATADQLAANAPARQVRAQVGEQIPGLGTVESINADGTLAVRLGPKQRAARRTGNHFTFRQNRPVQEQLLDPDARPVPQAPPGAPPMPPPFRPPADIPTTPAQSFRGGPASKPVRRSAAGVFRDSAPGRALRDMFVNRRGVVDSFGQTAADTLYHAAEQAAAATGQNVHDMIVQLGGVTKRASKELANGPGENVLRLIPEIADARGYPAFNELAIRNLEQTVDGMSLRTALMRDGMSESVKALDAFDDVFARQAGADLAARGGVRPMDGLLPEKVAAPRILTKEGQKALKGNLTMEQLFGIDTGRLRVGEDLSKVLKNAQPEITRLTTDASGRLKVADSAISGRTYADLPVREVNAELVRRLNLPEGTKLFDDDAMAQVALRSRTSFEAAAQTNLYEALAKESFDGENPMLTIVRPTDSKAVRDAARQKAQDMGWKRVESNTGRTPMIGEVYGPKEIVDEVAKIQDLIVNDEGMRRMADFITKWNGVWASQATVPLIFGTGFHGRNAIGNVILVFNGGVTNPARFIEGGKYQRLRGNVEKIMRNEGVNFETAISRAKGSVREKKLLRAMRDNGIVSEGFFADLSGDELENLLRHNKLSDWVNPKKIPARIGDNAVIRSGRKVGSAIEDNARIALFLDHYAKTGSIREATSQVKKYLFDYGDLTPFEKRVMKSTNRFYTFMRKNLAVQLYTLAMDPWRVQAVSRARERMIDQQATRDAAMPGYARESGFSVFRGLADHALRIETPMDAALEALDPIAQAVSLVPGLQEVVPERYRSSGQELAGSIFNFRSGGVQGLQNFIVEQLTGTDTFTGADISSEQGMKTWDRFGRAISPLYDKFRRAESKSFWDESETGMDARLALLQSLVGLSILPLDDKATNNVAYVAAQEAQNAIARLRDQGVDVPTYSELVAVGLAPDLSADKEPTRRRTSEEVAQDRVDKINNARRHHGAPLFVPDTQTTPAQGGGGKKRRGGILDRLG